jgi:diacylglycerol kinase (ATP)
MQSPYKGETGLKRILNAARNSLEGLAAAVRHEDAFRQELIIAAVLIPTAVLLNVELLEKAMLIGSILLVLIVELLNSAIEAVVDRISIEEHPLAKRAKDLGSAAVALSLATAAGVWLLVLFGR